MSERRCVLAYSGGLDTSAIVLWLREHGYEVHALLVDVGQDEDLDAACAKASRYGAASTEIVDVRASMAQSVLPYVIGLAARYEGNYRLGTALARPFIAEAQVRRALELGGATLVHGATGKGNDQIRFEFAYRALAPQLPVLAPWKVWDFAGRADLIAYLRAKGVQDEYEVAKSYSLDENLWHLSVEGGALEDPRRALDIAQLLSAVRGHFAQGANSGPDVVQLSFAGGVPLRLDGISMPLPMLIGQLNRHYRHADWAWDLVLENRFTGIKSRGVYINPAARLLQEAADALARSIFHKALYDEYVALGHRYAAMLYRGEYWSGQRVMLESAADCLLAQLDGSVEIALCPQLHVRRVEADHAIFTQELATFEASRFDHAHAEGFIRLNYLSSIGRPFGGRTHENLVAPGTPLASELRGSGSIA